MRRFVSLTACVLGAAACGDQAPGGTSYLLAKASNNPLPVMLRQERECGHYLYGGRVQFDGKGNFSSTYDIRKVCGDSTSAVPDIGTSGTFRLRNDTAFFSSANEPAGFGLISADSLVVNGPVHRLVYLRER